MERRTFLAGLGAVAGTLPGLPAAVEDLSGRLGRLEHDLRAAGPQDAFWQRVRQEFTMNPGLVHLNCGSLGATPRMVLDAMSSFTREIEGNPVPKTFSWGGEQMEDARARAAAFVGAELDELAFVRNTTEGMNAVALGLDLQPGDQVLTTNHEHGGGMTCWQYLREHRGVEIVYVDMPVPVGSAEQIVDRIASRITPRTRVCSLSHVETITGVALPLADIAAVTRPLGILLVCDGAQGPGMMDVDVKALRVDSYASSSHKWLLAPKGTGLLYVRREVQDRIRPAILHDGFASYSASSGTRNVPQILAHGVAIDFHETIGPARIEARARQLAATLRRGLDEIPALTVLSPSDPGLSTAMVTARVERGSSAEIVGRLRTEHDTVLKVAQGTYAYCTEDGLRPENYNAIRFSTHIFNDENELDKLLDVLNEVVSDA